ncbi:MAG: cell division ATPase MinD [Candidatus Hadarchaeales archaeon]
MTHVISFASGKGGTGKTMVVANLGICLAKRGRKVVALDADLAMANLGLLFGLEERFTLHDVLAGKAETEEALHEVFPKLEVLQGGLSLKDIGQIRLERLKGVVRKLAKRADYVLIDCPSGFEEDFITALTVSSRVVLVINPDPLSVAEAIKVKRMAEKFGVRPLGLVVNRVVGKDADLPLKEIEGLLELPLLGTIPEDEEVARSLASGRPVVLQTPKAPSSKALERIAEVILKGG